MQLQHNEELDEEVNVIFYWILFRSFTFLKIASQVNQTNLGFLSMCFLGIQ
jgi:hypothetical protein